MTFVQIKLYTGTGEPASGGVRVVATSRVPYEDGYLLPHSHQARLYNGEVTIDIPPSPEDVEPLWAWRFYEDIPGGTTRLVTVPDTTTVLNYADLLDLVPEDVPGVPGYIYVRTINGIEPDASGNVTISGAGGTIDHGGTTGLGDDDHPQYFNQVRGDARYIRTVNGTGPDAAGDVTVDGGTGGAPAEHTHDITDINATGTPDSTTYLRGDGTWSAAAGGGVTDHGQLEGRTDDDHPQYHNDARGDARYYTQAQIDASYGNVNNTSDLNKPISTATQTALNAKANTSVTYTKTEVDALVADTGIVVYRWNTSTQSWPDRGTEPFGSLWLSTNDQNAPVPTAGPTGPATGDMLAKLVL